MKKSSFVAVAIAMAVGLGIQGCSGGTETKQAEGGATTQNQPQNQPQAGAPTGAADDAKDSEDDPSMANETYGSDISDEHMGFDFEIPGTNDKVVKLSDTKGKVTALVFGYSYCPDVCPTNLMRFKNVLRNLKDRAGDLQVYFITVDPDRDTIPRMKKYLDLFSPKEVDGKMIGLVETDKNKLEEIKKAWRITANRVDLGGGKYLIDHSAGTYLVDPDGVTRLYQPHDLTVKQLTHDVLFLLDRKYEKK